MMNSSKFKAVRSPSPGNLHPEAMPWGHGRDQSPAGKQTLGNLPCGDQTAVRELWPHTLAAPQSIIFAIPWFPKAHGIWEYHGNVAGMVFMLFMFRVILVWEKEVCLSQESPLEREIHRKPGNFGSGAHGTFSLYLKRKYVEKAKKSSLEGIDKAIMIPWSSVETAECKTTTNISSWFLTFYLTVLLGEHSRIMCESTLFSALITSND